jgi:hypothetical protein
VERIGMVHTTRLDTIEVLVDGQGRLVVRAWDDCLRSRCEIPLRPADAERLHFVTGDAMDRLASGAPVAAAAPSGPAAGERTQALVERVDGLAGRLLA